MKKGFYCDKDREILLITENESNNFEVKSNNSQCIDCIHNDICQFYKALGATVICYPCGFYEAKSNNELFKQALVEGVNRRIDKTIEIEVITYEQDRFNHFINLMEKAQKSYDRLYKRYKDSPYLFEGTTLLSDAGRELQFYKDVIAMLGQSNQNQSDWISVEDRLPEESGEYLVFGRTFGNKKPQIWICECISIGSVIGWCNNAKNPIVEAWMPLPEAPKMKGGEE